MKGILMTIKDFKDITAKLSKFPDDTPVKLIGNDCPGNYELELLDSVIYADKNTKGDMAVIWVNRAD